MKNDWRKKKKKERKNKEIEKFLYFPFSPAF
jgi:hypothetical protein